MRILLLGGTADARKLAEALILHGIDIVYSIAGLVRRPIIQCDVLIGGFSQFGGLSRYLSEQDQTGKRISMILDATHPYAEKMSNQAVLSAQDVNIPCWRFYRPEWQATSEDIWINYPNQESLQRELNTRYSDKKTLLLTAGQFNEAELSALSSLNFEKILLRTAVSPKFSLDEFAKITWVKAIGPFSFEDERVLIEQCQVDVIVSKNSGGDATSAKLAVARRLSLPILMQTRPVLLAAIREFSDIQLCIAAVSHFASIE